jgi:hypothetical protein
MKGKEPNIFEHYCKISACIRSSKTENHLDACRNMIDTFFKFSNHKRFLMYVNVLIEIHSKKYLTI